MLGELPDAVVAERTGRPVNAVRIKRQRLDIPNPGVAVPRHPRPWTAEGDELLLSLPPAEVAERTGRSMNAVYRRRNILRLPSLKHRT